MATKTNAGWNRLTGILIIICCLIGLCACASSKKKDDAAARATGPAPKYLDFEDVLIPAELKLNKEESFMYETGGVGAGVLVLKGRVDLDSLIAFFENNMARDNWALVSKFKSPRTVMMFNKQNRWCVINITEETWSNLVEVWVAPTYTSANALTK